jgi:hypothetical protein
MVRTYAIPDYGTLAAGHGGRVEEHYDDLRK